MSIDKKEVHGLLLNLEFVSNGCTYNRGEFEITVGDNEIFVSIGDNEEHTFEFWYQFIEYLVKNHVQYFWG